MADRQPLKEMVGYRLNEEKSADVPLRLVESPQETDGVGGGFLQGFLMMLSIPCMACKWQYPCKGYLEYEQIGRAHV